VSAKETFRSTTKVASSAHISNGKILKKAASGTLKPGQLKPISDAVTQLDPNGWNKPGLNVSAADAFGYKLEFHRGKDQAFNVQWYDNTADQLPDDLKKLSDVLLKRMSGSCDGTP